MRKDDSLEQCERALLATALWELRVVAGWCPPLGSARVRVLAGPFELANIDGALASFADGSPSPAFELGSLGSVRLSPAVHSVEDLRSRLEHSPWGDPGTSDPGAIRLSLQLTLAGRVADAVPEAAYWASSYAVLVVARCLALGVPVTSRSTVARLLGGRTASATTLEELRSALPSSFAPMIEHVTGANDLWRGEARCWSRLADEAADRVRHGGADRETVVAGIVALLSDARRVRAALALAAHGGAEVELLDAAR